MTVFLHAVLGPLGIFLTVIGAACLLDSLANRVFHTLLPALVILVMGLILLVI